MTVANVGIGYALFMIGFAMGLCFRFQWFAHIHKGLKITVEYIP